MKENYSRLLSPSVILSTVETYSNKNVEKFTSLRRQCRDHTTPYLKKQESYNGIVPENYIHPLSTQKVDGLVH